MTQSIIQYELLSPDRLIPTEEIDHSWAIELEERIVAAGKWTAPIAIHIDELFVMDGHHRLTVAKRLKLDLLPVFLLDYGEVEVTAWRDGEEVTAAKIHEMVRNGRRFPPKTTRHIFKRPLPNCAVPLANLRHPISLRNIEAIGTPSVNYS